MRDANELVSKPIVATQEGRELGRVKDVVFDPEGHALLGLVVTVTATAGSDTTMFVGRRSVNAIGDDAVTVSGMDALQPLNAEPRAVEIMESGVHLKGANVLTEGGNSVGKIDKILINDDGSVAPYHTSTGVLGFGEKGEIPPGEVVSVGQDAIIIRDSAAREVLGEREGEERGDRPRSTGFEPGRDRPGARSSTIDESGHGSAYGGAPTAGPGPERSRDYNEPPEFNETSDFDR